MLPCTSAGLLSLCMCLDVDGGLAATTVEQVRSAHADALKTLKTGHVVFLRESTAPKPPPDRAASIARSFKKDSEQAKQAIREMELNTTSRRDQIQMYFNRESAEWKLSSQDARDLDRIMADEKFPQWRRKTLDLSLVQLVGPTFGVDLFPATNVMLVHEQVLANPLEFGIASDDLFLKSRQSSIVAVSPERGSHLRVKLDSWVLEVDPQLEFRCRNAKLYAPDGRLRREESFDDYRLVDGFNFPFRYERHDYDLQGGLTRHTMITVASAQFNRPLPPDAFQLTIGEPVRIMGAPQRRSVVLPGGRAVTLDQLQAMILGAIKAQRGSDSIPAEEGK